MVFNNSFCRVFIDTPLSVGAFTKELADKLGASAEKFNHISHSNLHFKVTRGEKLFPGKKIDDKGKFLYYPVNIEIDLKDQLSDSDYVAEVETILDACEGLCVHMVVASEFEHLLKPRRFEN